MAEYQALIMGLHVSYKLGVAHLLAKGDSQLVTQQSEGDYRCTSPTMAYYQKVVQANKTLFSYVTFQYVPRKENYTADAIA